MARQKKNRAVFHRFLRFSSLRTKERLKINILGVARGNFLPCFRRKTPRPPCGLRPPHPLLPLRNMLTSINFRKESAVSADRHRHHPPPRLCDVR